MNIGSILSYVSACACAALAIAVLIRARRDIADWAFIAALVALVAERVFGALSLNAATIGVAEMWQRHRLEALSLHLGSLLAFSLTYARGNARMLLAKWRVILGLAFVAPAAIAIGYGDRLFGLAPHEMTSPWLLRLAWPGIVLNLLLLAGSVLVVMNLERTFRASVGTMRWRIKFMLLGVAVICVARIYTCSQALLFRGIDPRHESINAVAVLIGLAVVLRSVRRTGRAHADVYPSESVLAGSITILVAGIYFLVVGLFAKIAMQLGGDAAFALKAFILLLSVVVLAILLQSDRVRLHVRRIISRNFQRPVYDYRAIWRKFTEGTASCVDQTELCRAVVKLTADVFQALAVTIWIVNEKKDSVTVAASTTLSDAKSREWAPEGSEAADVIAYFQLHPEPVDIEVSQEKWAVALRRWQSSEFPNGGHRMCAPLLRQAEIVGVMMVGDRVSGVRFPAEDIDLLKCITDHATASLLNVQLSHRLLQSKQLEAFQTMATFFVHDLKNAASTLNLMLQNLPVHFNDPAFREDALRGIAKTVTHINGLIRRLGMIRHELKITLGEADLNDVVSDVLKGFGNLPKATISKQLGPLPRIPLDQEQVHKVITNLVLNATEAAPEHAEVRVLTHQENGWAVLTVADNGCGMTPEFLQRSLFRPFQTTKQSGLGIGMFQSRMIVEAHGGRITATSERGKGTTFHVYLPVRTV